MKSVTVKDLIDVVASSVDSPDLRLEKMFDWEHTRNLEIAKWTLAVAGALFVPVIIAAAKGELSGQNSTWWLTGCVFTSIALAGFGLRQLRSMYLSQRNYVAAMTLLADLHDLKPLIRRYRKPGSR